MSFWKKLFSKWKKKFRRDLLVLYLDNTKTSLIKTMQNLASTRSKKLKCFSTMLAHLDAAANKLAFRKFISKKEVGVRKP